MSQIQELTSKLQRELYSKVLPGEVILNLREKWLEKFLERYSCNLDALMLGFMFCDFKLQEALELRKESEHIRMALDYAQQAFERYSEIPSDVQNIVLEIIKTHHGGDAKSTESKLYRNADAISFLEPKAWMHFFSQFYDKKTNSSFHFALKKVDEKVQEKFALIDLDKQAIDEANLLKEKYDWFKSKLL